MKYMGSKNRIAKYLLPIILKDRKEGQWYVEPFVGGCNMIDKVDGLRMGNDRNEYLIAMWKALQNGWVPPEVVTELEYQEIKNNQDFYPKELVAYVGFAMSFGSKWWAGYAKNGRGDRYDAQGYNSMMKQLSKIKDVQFSSLSYFEMIIPQNSIIYCDPPYFSATRYKDKFYHDKFWQWCREKVRQGHWVFVSEYIAPDDFVCIKEIQTNTQLANGSNSGNMVKIEKLFCHKSQYKSVPKEIQQQLSLQL